MFTLILQTFLLSVFAVGAGVLVGVLVKQWFGRRTVGSDTLTEMMAAAVAAEEASEAATVRPAVPVETPEAAAVAPSPVSPPLAEPPPPEPEVLTGPAAEVSAGLDRIATADKVGERPAALPGPRDGLGDDLRRIKGIGPQNAARLNFLGIYHYDQIAAWLPPEVRWVGAYLSFPGRIEREDWIGQAKALVADQSASGKADA